LSPPSFNRLLIPNSTQQVAPNLPPIPLCPTPASPPELHALIVLSLSPSSDRQTLATLCLVSSSLRILALRQLYLKLTFRSWAALEACFLGRSSRRPKGSPEEEAAWSSPAKGEEGGGRGGQKEWVLERRKRELKWVKEMEFVGFRSSGGGGLKIPDCLKQDGPFRIDTVRLSLASTDRFSSLLHILSPRRLIVHTNQIHSTLSDLALSPDVPLILDICAPRPPLLLSLLPGVVGSVVWSTLHPTRVPNEADLLQLISYSTKTRIVLRTMKLQERTEAMMAVLRAEGVIEEGKDVGVVCSGGERRVKMQEGRIVWNDGVVDGVI
jgi:hypothetical protein